MNRLYSQVAYLCVPKRRKMSIQGRIAITGLLAWLLSAGMVFPVTAVDIPEAVTDQAALRINEFMAENTSTLENPGQAGDFPDWFELYNPGPEAVSLDNLFLTDDPTDPIKYIVPPGLTIPASGFLLFYADNMPELGPQHTNFALNKAGEYLGLYTTQGTVLIDGYEFGEQAANVST